MTENQTRYRVLRRLGKGSFGVVYLAEVEGLGGFTRQVALKMLVATQHAPADALLRFRDEARILGLLQHRAVVRVENLCRMGEEWAVVMEYVPGVDLTRAIRAGRMPPRPALQAIEEVASALHAAFAEPSPVSGKALELLHRDIKPPNIRLTPEGEVKVLDFGIARASFSAREAETRDGIMGSIRYMAPERLEGVESPAADVYSLGLVLVELLTGESREAGPKHPGRYPEFLANIEREVRQVLWIDESAGTAESQEAILQLVRGMLAFEPADRPSAKRVEDQTARLVERIPGPRLRDWAREAVPALLAQAATPPVDERTGMTLVASSGEISLHGLDESTAQLVRAATPPGVLPRFDTGRFAPFAPATPRGWMWVLAALAVVVVGLSLAWAVRGSAGSGDPLAQPPIPGPPSPPVLPPDPKPPPKTDTDKPPAPPRPIPIKAPPIFPTGKPHVTVVGDAERVVFHQGNKAWTTPELPVGQYTIEAWFGGPVGVAAGTVEVKSGARLQIRCHAAMAKCSAEETP